VLLSPSTQQLVIEASDQQTDTERRDDESFVRNKWLTMYTQPQNLSARNWPTQLIIQIVCVCVCVCVNPRGFQVLLNAEKEVSKLWALLSSLLAIQSEAGKKKGNLLTPSRPEPVHQHPPVQP
jgi:hypothetical protein